MIQKQHAHVGVTYSACIIIIPPLRHFFDTIPYYTLVTWGLGEGLCGNNMT